MSFEIATYHVMIERGTLGGGRVPVEASIICKDATGTQELIIGFVTEGADIPGCGASSTTRASMYLPFGSFGAVIDLLRNEKPMWALIGWPPGSTTPRVALATGTAGEPVGEGE